MKIYNADAYVCCFVMSYISKYWQIAQIEAYVQVYSTNYKHYLSEA